MLRGRLKPRPCHEDSGVARVQNGEDRHSHSSAYVARGASRARGESRPLWQGMHRRRHDRGCEEPNPDRAEGQQQCGEDQGVGVDDPGDPGLSRVEISVDLRQRDIDDYHVEKDEEIPGAQAEDEQLGHPPTLSTRPMGADGQTKLTRYPRNVGCGRRTSTSPGPDSRAPGPDTHIWKSISVLSAEIRWTFFRQANQPMTMSPQTTIVTTRVAGESAKTMTRTIARNARVA